MKRDWKLVPTICPTVGCNNYSPYGPGEKCAECEVGNTPAKRIKRKGIKAK